MTKFYVETPNRNLRITTIEIHYPEFVSEKWVSRWRAREKLTGIDTGGRTEKEAYYNLIQYIALQ